MGARDLLDRLAGAGLSVTVRGDSLVISPWAAVPIELLAELRDYKPALVALLSGGATAANQMLAPQPSLLAASCCTDCQHLLRRGTCAEPVAAGLLSAEQGSGIAWPAKGYGATCAAFGLRKGLS